MLADTSVRHCVIIPFFNRVDQVHTCLQQLLAQALPDTEFLLVDDASTDNLIELDELLYGKGVFLIRHPRNEGVSAARNSALQWCRERGHAVVIMIDSDCIPGPDFIETHVRLHVEMPEVACVGAAIVGRGSSVWSRLDGVASWVHAAPHYRQHEVEHPYHLPTTNFSVKLSMLPDRPFVFDERLCTGEDCLLIRELRRQGLLVLFSPSPVIYHRDRERLLDVLRHHYKWGHHQYFIQLGRDISPYVFNPAYRIVFLLVFFWLWPLYSLTGATLNIVPWLSTRLGYLSYAPGVFALWLCKGIAVMEAALRPRSVLRAARSSLDYEPWQPGAQGS